MFKSTVCLKRWVIRLCLKKLRVEFKVIWVSSSFHSVWPKVARRVCGQWRIQELPDGGWRQFFKIIYAHHSWGRKPLEGFGIMLPRKILKSEPSNSTLWSIFRPKSGRFFGGGPWTGGGGRAPTAPPSGSATGGSFSRVFIPERYATWRDL